MDLAARILLRKEALGLSQEEIANRAGISQGMVAKLVSRKSTSTSKLPELARALEVSVNWLATGSDVPRYDSDQNIAEAPASHTNGVPVLSFKQAGELSESDHLHKPGFTDVWIPVRPKRRMKKREYALVVEGDSMTNQHDSKLNFPAGTYIYVDPEQTEPQSENLIVAKLTGTDTVIFKQYKVEDGRPYLSPLNSNFKPNFDDFDVLGRVIGKYDYQDI